MSNFDFQYCQKIVLFDENDRILLARRKGEADYNEVYSLLGGKLETTDGGILEGIRREIQEEIGAQAQIKIAPNVSYNIYFTKRSGDAMILPHIYGIYIGGDIVLNDEYSDYAWVDLKDLDEFEPKIDTIPAAVAWTQKIRQIIEEKDLVRL